MKKISLVILVFVFLTLSGCATKQFVKDEVTPLGDRVTAVEGKLDQLMKDESANKAALQEARDEAKKAMDMAEKADAEARRVGTEAQASEKRAEAAATKAERAAREAEQAMKKSEKIFKLEQKK